MTTPDSSRPSAGDTPEIFAQADEEKALEFFGLAGFEFWSTGGNCTAYGRYIDDNDGEDGHHVIVTDGDAQHPITDGPCTVGLYSNEDSALVESVDVDDFTQAIEAANRLIAAHIPSDEDISRVDVTWPTGEGVARDLPLTDVLPDPDERAEALKALATKGEFTVGGGAAPAVVIRPAAEIVATPRREFA